MAIIARLPVCRFRRPHAALSHHAARAAPLSTGRTRERASRRALLAARSRRSRPVLSDVFSCRREATGQIAFECLVVISWLAVGR